MINIRLSPVGLQTTALKCDGNPFFKKKKIARKLLHEHDYLISPAYLIITMFLSFSCVPSATDFCSPTKTLHYEH